MDKLCFVQFLHPGGEHKPDRGVIKEWNKNTHRRKFLKRLGGYVADGKVQKADILLWGEWEPESRVERKIAAPIVQGPHYINEPYYVVPKSYRGLQNTDPFVFGEQFHYTFCYQSKPTLRHLSPGSIILFGSRNDHVFVLDTVFVVSDRWIDHTKVNHRKVLAGAISQEYEEVTILPMYQEPIAESKNSSQACSPASSQQTWRLYFGASYDRPMLDMYSFFPCQPYEAESRGFARPSISLPNIVDNLSQNFKCTMPPSLHEMKSLWDKVAKQVKDQGLALGVYAEMPQRRTGDPSFFV
jgi:hypothetical protein